ncbi:MAG: TRAP transporter large permease [Proteobacteria bacterium]|nr:TRAP transporter large permease [Pseudomonadota bacterium]
MPIGFAMALLPTVYIAITDVVPLTAVPYQMYTALDKFPLVAVPLFLLAGELMNLGAVTDRLLELSRELVGRVRGGLSHITVMMSMLFASLNGSAVASTATIGGIMIPAMKKAGYSASFSASVTAVSSTIGGIIPPSIAIVLFASVTNQSVGRLFSAGILPGILVGIFFMVVSYVISVRRNYERYEVPFTFAALGRAFMRSVLALTLPLILYFGIIGGVFTPTEAGAVVCFLAFVIGKYVYKALSWQDLRKALTRTVRLSAAIFIIIAAAGPFSWLLTRLGALQGLESWLVGYQDNMALFMIAFLTVILFAGMLSDIVANLIILGPTLLMAAEKVGISDTQASMVICVGFLLGTVTPPVGICYFTAARIAEEKLEKVAVELLPFIGAEVLLLILILLFPALTGFVPQLAGFL